MKRLISIVLLTGLITLIAGCFGFQPHTTTEDRPTTDESAEHKSDDG
ncbi:MAG: hypothetical protein WCG21_12645 [Eubacteriales bacterium]